jgi:hypothetical protein
MRRTPSSGGGNPGLARALTGEWNALRYKWPFARHLRAGAKASSRRQRARRQRTITFVRCPKEMLFIPQKGYSGAGFSADKCRIFCYKY